jgi:hypothetical protein
VSSERPPEEVFLFGLHLDPDAEFLRNRHIHYVKRQNDQSPSLERTVFASTVNFFCSQMQLNMPSNSLAFNCCWIRRNAVSFVGFLRLVFLKDVWICRRCITRDMRHSMTAKIMLPVSRSVVRNMKSILRL